VPIRAIPLILLAVLSGPAVAVGSLSAPTGGPVLVILPPWVDREGLLAAAGLRDIGPVQPPFAVLAARGDDSDWPDATSLGAWGVFDGTSIAQLCGVYWS